MLANNNHGRKGLSKMRKAKPGDRVVLTSALSYGRAHLDVGEGGVVTYVGGDELGQYGVEVRWDKHHVALNFWENHTLLVEEDLGVLLRTTSAPKSLPVVNKDRKLPLLRLAINSG